MVTSFPAVDIPGLHGSWGAQAAWGRGKVGQDKRMEEVKDRRWWVARRRQVAELRMRQEAETEQAKDERWESEGATRSQGGEQESDTG